MLKKLTFRIMGLLLLQGAVLLSCASPSMAQTAPSDNLKFNLVALDAITKGAVSASTIEIQFGVALSNDSPNSYSSITVKPTGLTISNFPANAPTDSGVGPFASNTWSNVTPFSQYVYNLMPPPSMVSLKAVTTSRAIQATMNLSVQVTSLSGAITSYNAQAEAIVYTPSNNDLIPQIDVGIGTETQQLTELQNQVNGVNSNIGIGTTGQSVSSQLTVLQNGENTIESGTNGEATIVNKENQILNKP